MDVQALGEGDDPLVSLNMMVAIGIVVWAVGLYIDAITDDW